MTVYKIPFPTAMWTCHFMWRTVCWFIVYEDFRNCTVYCVWGLQKLHSLLCMRTSEIAQIIVYEDFRNCTVYCVWGLQKLHSLLCMRTSETAQFIMVYLSKSQHASNSRLSSPLSTDVELFLCLYIGFILITYLFFFTKFHWLKTHMTDVTDITI